MKLATSLPTQHPAKHPATQSTARRTPLAALLLLAVSMAAPGRCDAASASVGPDGRLFKDGSAWFPLGLYHVSWIGDRMGEKAVGDLHLLADAGFDLMHATVDARPDMIELLDAASARGVEILAEVPWPDHGPDDFVNKWKAHPAIVGWNIRDDFNAPTFGPVSHPPAEVAARRAVIDALDPSRLTYASGTPFPGATVAPYAGTMEVMGFQSYPIGEQSYPEEYELEEAMDEFDYVRAQLAGSGQSWVANVQAYRWKSSVGRYPTLREARNLLYAPLIRGANGLLWYTMWEGSGTLLPSAAPALWAELPTQVAEMKSLLPFLLHGELSTPDTGLERVHAGAWTLDGQVVVAVLNTHRTASFPVSIPLPPGGYEALAPMFPARSESGMKLDGGNLSGTIAPEQVHVYLLDATTPGNASPTAVASASPDEVAWGEPRTFDAGASFDSDGSIAAIEWDFGDGASATGAVVQHAWPRPGTWWSRVTVRDDDGATATAFVRSDVASTSLCPPAPRGDCTPAPSSVKMAMPASAGARSLQWKWSGGSAASFGSPTTSTEVALCVYDAGGRRLATATRPDAAAWKDRGAAGLRFKDRDAKPGGLFSMSLRPGTGTARVQLKARGSELPAIALPMVAPVTVQLVESDVAGCQESLFGVDDIGTNDAGRFSASVR